MGGSGWAPKGLPLDEFSCYQMMNYEDVHFRTDLGTGSDLGFFHYQADLKSVQKWFFTQTAEDMLETHRVIMQNECPDVVCSLNWFPPNLGALSHHARRLRRQSEAMEEFVSRRVRSNASSEES